MSREMKQSGIPWIGEIPISWEVMPHKRVMHKIKEIQEHYNGEDILSLTMRGVIVRDLDAGGKMPTSFDGYQKVYPNNLLQCLFDIDVTPRCVGLIKNEGLTSPAYSQFEMHSNAYAPYYDYLLRYMDDGKTLLHLSKNLRSSLTETDFGAIDTCVPSIIEQQKIASFLDRKCAEIDEMIALQEKIVEELKAYKQSVILEAVTKGLNPDVPMKDSGIEWIGEIPEHWEVLKSKKILLSNDGGVWGEEPDGIDDTVVLRSTEQDIDGKLIIIEPAKRKLSLKEREASLLKRGDLIITKSSGSPSHIGKTSIIDEGVENLGCCYSNFIQRIRVKGEPKYYWYIFNSLIVKKQFEYLSTTTTGINNINSKIIEALFLPCTSAEEQEGIALYLDTKCTEIDNLISIKLSKIDSLKEYKKSIIYEYVTGKKEVI